jgi:hypothetical protein
MGSHKITNEDHEQASFRLGVTSPIGSERLQAKITITRIGKNQDGNIVYLDELDSKRRFELIIKSFSKGDESYSEPATAQWNRLTVITARDAIDLLRSSQGRLKPGTYPGFLTLAKWPYSSGLAFTVPFKRHKNESDDILTRKLPAVFPSERAYIQALESLMTDYEVTTEGIVASVSMPKECELTLRESSSLEDAELVYGACSNPQAVFDELEVCPTSIQLIDLTESGKLLFTYDRRPERIHDSVKRNCHKILNLSIRQAMAGLRESEVSLLGESVEKKIDSVYRLHIDRLNYLAFSGHDDLLGGTCFDLKRNDQAYVRPKGLFSFMDSVELIVTKASTIDEIPQSGGNLVVVALIDGSIVVRIFDHRSKCRFDKAVSSGGGSISSHARFCALVSPLFDLPMLDEDQRTFILESLSLILTDEQ